jgi:hypothetical protein
VGKVDIPYYVVKKGKYGYWQPSAAMRAEGFKPARCGLDGPTAWNIAAQWNERWQRHRQGRAQDQASKWPVGSIGEAFERLKKTDVWTAKKPRTREEWERAWSRISPVFGDLPPTSAEISLESLSRFRSFIANSVSSREAWRVIKIWRALWNVCASLQYCGNKKDPSLAISNSAPAPRSASWSEGETVILAKMAWRKEYHGLAVAIAFAWDTQFSPVDLRGLTMAGIRGQGADRHFPVDRAKSGRSALGTLSKRSLALLDAYLEKQPCEVGAILRNRSGAVYSRFTMPDDFAVVREMCFSGDKRTLADMRRSGAIELQAGGAAPSATAAKMANSISSANAIHKTYQPVDLETVRQADAARRLGRQRIRNGNKEG